MKKRAVLHNEGVDEQGLKLHSGLQKATIIMDGPPAKRGMPPTPRRRLRELVAKAVTRLFAPISKPACGVPHGVRSAIVFAKGVRIKNDDGDEPLIFFCHTRNYRVLQSTMGDADNGEYPDVSRTTVSAGCPIPPSGDYNARMRVSVNGELHAHFETFEAMET